MQSARLSLLDDGLVLLSGILEKEGGTFRTWKKRFFILHRSMLYYFEKESQVVGGAAAAKASIVVAGATLRALDSTEIPGRPYAMGLTPACSSHRFVLVAASEDLRIEWMSAFVQAGAQLEDPRTMKKRLAVEETSAAAFEAVTAPGRRISASAAASGPTSGYWGPMQDKMFPSSSHEGFLMKLGGVNKDKFQQRFFAILGSHLMYFEVLGDIESARGTINLHDAVVDLETDANRTLGQRFVFSVTPKEKPRSSLFSTLFGETLKNYVLAARDEADLRQWMQAIKAETDRKIDADDGSDDEGELSEEEVVVVTPPKSHSHPLKSSFKSSSFEDELDSHFPAPSTPTAPSFIPPTADVLSHCYKLDGDPDRDASELSWKRRYCGLDVNSRTIKMWKHKPAGGQSANKPKTIDLTDARVAVHPDLRCSKAKFHPSVLAITLHATSQHHASASTMHLGFSSRSHFNEWYSLLLLTLGKTRSATIAAAAPAASSAASSSKPPRTPGSRKNSEHAPPNPEESPSVSERVARRSAADREAMAQAAFASTSSAPSTPAPSTPASHVGSLPRASPLSQSALLAAMSDALADPAAMDHFRLRSVELARGAITAAQYFKSYFRLFGKRDGLRFWSDLMDILPRDEIRVEMRDLFKAHEHLFTEDRDTPASAAPANPPSAAGDEDSPVDDSPPIIPPLPMSFGSAVSSSTPSFSMGATGWLPTAEAAESPLSSVQEASASPASPKRRPVSPPAPSTSTSSSTVRSPPPATIAQATEAVDRMSLRDTLSDEVDAWDRRGESNILTLLCTLHEVLPGLVCAGQFIPPLDDGYPTLKEVKSTYLRAMLTIHPDKTKARDVRTQIASELTFQRVTHAWDMYEKAALKAEKKKAKQAAK